MSQLDAIEIQVQVYAKSPLSGIAKTNPGHRNWYHCVEWAQFGIVIYEYLITLDLEVERFWKRKTKGLGSVLFYVNRYLTLLGNIGIIVLFMSPELVLRHNFVINGMKLADPFAPIWGTASQVQFYLANWKDTSYINTVFPIPVLYEVGTVPSFTTAHFQLKMSRGLHIIYIYTGIFVFDICVVSLTLWKTLKIYKEEHFPGGVGIMILRDAFGFFLNGNFTLTHATVLPIGWNGYYKISADNLVQFYVRYHDVASNA
ncbi:hypothetical protein GG344DRAFT_70267 [Lentinula edodes]|nr:hypothetical protein GG344DRAFT_70267 [Lentinula edodes]